jgi:transcriptional regulator with XRE-family HTH domain
MSHTIGVMPNQTPAGRRCQAARNHELGEFLRARREAADAAAWGSPRRRRVPGLRREEVAGLAGVSADYYARLEQGRQPTASPQVLDALAGALGLTGAERAHLHNLSGRYREEECPAVQQVRAGRRS